MPSKNIDFEEVLRRAGHRVTRQRQLILEAVCEGEGHITLKQIDARVQQAGGTVDPSSLYRALKLFVDLGLVLSAVTPDGETYYEIPKTYPHHHLVCRVCKQQIEIGSEATRRMFEMIYQQHHFRVDVDHLVLPGLCEACQEKQRKSQT